MSVLKYKEAQKQARAVSQPKPIIELPIGIMLGIKAFKRANPGATAKDIKAYKQGAWAKLKEIKGGN